MLVAVRCKKLSHLDFGISRRNTEKLILKYGPHFAHSGKLVLYNLNLRATGLTITNAMLRSWKFFFLSHTSQPKKICRNFELQFWLFYSPMRPTTLSIGFRIIKWCLPNKSYGADWHRWLKNLKNKVAPLNEIIKTNFGDFQFPAVCGGSMQHPTK